MIIMKYPRFLAEGEIVRRGKAMGSPLMCYHHHFPAHARPAFSKFVKQNWLCNSSQIS